MTKLNWETLIYYVASDDMMTHQSWTGKNLEGCDHGLRDILFRYVPGETEEETSVRTVDVPNDVQTEHIPNKSPELYLQTSLFGFTLLFVCSAYYWALKMEAINYSVTSVRFYQITRRHIQEDSILLISCMFTGESRGNTSATH
jgi:hypothetical protein